MRRDKKFTDFHTHNLTDVPTPRAIASYSLPQITSRPYGQYYTVGLHPWHTERLDAYRAVEQNLSTYLADEYCLALGEVGLDRLRGASLGVQTELLALQLHLCARLHKPVVIHCVRAWSELLNVFHKVKFPGNKAVHGYRGSLAILERLLDDGWYISAGFYTPAETTLRIPREQLLLETDDTKQPIATLYAQTAQLLDSTVEDLQTMVMSNIRRFINQEE